jgi:membrane protease YdiL (CAAX protease family)
MTIGVKLRRGIECALLFVGLPLVWYFEPIRLPKLPSLVIVTLICILVLRRDAEFRGHALWRVLCQRRELGRIVGQALVVFALMTAWVWLTSPRALFYFPRRVPHIWIIVMCGYPLVSALPQEFIYRTFFFHRYRPVFGSGWPLVVASAVLFSFLHIIYDNVPALVLTLVAGLAFAWTYARTHSLALVSIEHALYGCAAYTLGLGHFFYEGH